MARGAFSLRRAQSEDVSRFGGGGDRLANQREESNRLLDERRVAWRENALLEVEVAFEPHPSVAAKRRGKRDEGRLRGVDAERGPVAANPMAP